MTFAGLLLASLIAQTPNPAAVDGTVTNQITGQPVKKASVRLVGTSSGKSIGLSANTDATGRFHFDRVDPGKYSVWADCPGYGSNSGGGYIQVVEEQQVKDVAIRLTPLGMAAGRVFDEDGEPMMSVPVFAFHYVYPPGRKELEQSGFASTDDLGRFQMMDLPPGKYFFEAEVRPRPPLPERTVSTIPEIAYPPTYYPNGTSLAQAASLEVKPGVELGGLDFHLKPQAAFHVRGRVTDVAPGDVTNQINLHLDRPGVRWGEQSSAPVQLQAGGTFDIRNVVNGEYILMAMHFENGNMKFARQAVNVSGKDVDDIALTPAPGSVIHGAVVFEGMPPQQSAGQSFVLLEGVGGLRFGGRPFPIKNGSFLIQGMTPDLYLVKLQTTPPGTYLKSVQFNDHELPDATLDLTNPSNGELRIVLGTDPGKIHGSVQTRSGQTAANVTVTAAPPSERASFPGLFQSTTTDQNGNFQFQNAAPGEYRILAWETSDGFPVLDPEFEKLFESTAVKVTLQSNGNEPAQVIAIPIAEMQAAKEKQP